MIIKVEKVILNVESVFKYWSGKLMKLKIKVVNKNYGTSSN